jgi:hypothetical protein
MIIKRERENIHLKYLYNILEDRERQRRVERKKEKES